MSMFFDDTFLNETSDSNSVEPPPSTQPRNWQQRRGKLPCSVGSILSQLNQILTTSRSISIYQMAFTMLLSQKIGRPEQPQLVFLLILTGTSFMIASVMLWLSPLSRPILAGKAVTRRRRIHATSWRMRMTSVMPLKCIVPCW